MAHVSRRGRGMYSPVPTAADDRPAAAPSATPGLVGTPRNKGRRTPSPVTGKPTSHRPFVAADAPTLRPLALGRGEGHSSAPQYPIAATVTRPPPTEPTEE